jgi:hypothetical protein
VSFSDGWRHWAVSDAAIKQWEGDQEPAE